MKKLIFLNNVSDTTFFIDYNLTIKFNLRVKDLTPTFKVDYLSSALIYTSYGATDLAFNGTNIVASDSYYIYNYSVAGTYLKVTPFLNSMDFFGCQGADTYWAGESNAYSTLSLNKVDAKTGSKLGSVSVYISNTAFIDVEIFDSKFWLLGKTSLYKATMLGEQQATLDFKTILEVSKLIGIVQKNNYLYVLLVNGVGEYVVYKVDPATLKVIKKGYLPASLNSKILKGLTFDNTNFWTLSISGSNYDNLVKFNITE